MYLPLANTTISSLYFKCRILALPILLGLCFTHVSFSLNILKLLATSEEVKGSVANNTIAPRQMRLNSLHIGSNGIILSQLHEVVPYGKSHIIASTLLSASRGHYL